MSHVSLSLGAHPVVTHWVSLVGAVSPAGPARSDSPDLISFSVADGARSAPIGADVISDKLAQA